MRWLSGGKLFLGFLFIFSLAVILAPSDGEGHNIFLGRANLSNVLRQVANNGILAVGMTMVILTAGIDLSVGSVMAVGCTVTAMLLTQKKWSAATWVAIPSSTLVVFGFAAVLVHCLLPIKGKIVRGVSSAAIALAVSCVACGWLCSKVHTGFDLWSVILAGPAVCLLLGLTSGAFVAYGKLQPFIVTLAMMTTALGAGRLISGRGGAVHSIYENGPQAVDSSFWILGEFLGKAPDGSGGWMPVPGIIFLGCTILASVVLARTRFGRHIYAVGGSAETARLSGISVARTQLAVYAISGALAGLTGLLYAAQYRQGKPDAGAQAELDAIAAVVVGGTRLMGGQGSVLGTLAGVLMLGVLNNILSLKGVDSNIQLILKGAIILGAVLLQEGRNPLKRVKEIVGRICRKEAVR